VNPERYQLIKKLFLDACEVEPAERAAFLDEACGDDRELRAEVENMLRQDEAPLQGLDPEPSGGFRQVVEGALRDELDADADDQPRSIPRRIGPYRIVRLVGEGGMGVVYEAEQEHPRRRVALKVMRTVFASESALRRFEFEVEVLGRLEHPGIARLYDAGAAETDGVRQSFFAMEFVDGLPLTRYADRAKLDRRQRVELLARVCDAVQYAHQRGVIHRDLKPANILVHDDPGASSTDSGGGTHVWNVGQPKVLDFGVARAADRELQHTTMHTRAGQLVGTIPYMSPEQVSGAVNDVDVRSDVYALGVILFELIAGGLPYDLSDCSALEAARVIREREPLRLGAVNSQARGDLETIVAKALQKDKDQCYASAAQFGADLRRYLRDEPIIARPASTFYQLRKLARRHKATTASTALALVGVLLGGSFATWQAIVATEQRDRAVEAERLADAQLERAINAERRAVEQLENALAAERRAEAVNDFLRDMLRAADPRRTADRDITMIEVLDRASDMVDRRLTGDAVVAISVHEAIGDTYESLGVYDRAERHDRRALELAREVYGDDHAQTHAMRTNLALVLRQQNRYDEAESLAKQAYEGLLAAVGPDHDDTISALANLGLVYFDQARYEEAEPLLTEAVERRERIESEPSEGYFRHLGALGTLYAMTGRLEESERVHREVLERRLELLGPDHPDIIYSTNNLARILQERGKIDEAATMLDEAVESAPEILGEEHPITLTVMNNLGGIYTTLGRHAEAAEVFERVVEFSRRVHGERHGNTLTAMNNLAGSYEKLGQYDRAEPLYLATLEARRELYGDAHPNTLTSVNNLGFLYRATGRYTDAEPLFIQAVEGFTEAVGENHPSTLIATSNLGNLYNDMELYSEAERYNDRVCRALETALPPDHWFRGVADVRHAVSLAGLERFEEAEEKILKGRRVIESALGADHERMHDTVEKIVWLYERWGRQDEAENWRARLESTNDDGAG